MNSSRSLQVKVLGPGCVNCKVVEQRAAVALLELIREVRLLKIELIHVEDPVEIQKYPILATPGLVINEKVVCAGRSPSRQEILEWLRSAVE